MFFKTPPLEEDSAVSFPTEGSIQRILSSRQSKATRDLNKTYTEIPHTMFGMTIL